MPFDYFTHLFVVLPLFFRRTLSRANITVIPVKRVQCLNFLLNHNFKLSYIWLPDPDQFFQSFLDAAKLPMPAKQSDAALLFPWLFLKARLRSPFPNIARRQVASVITIFQYFP